MSDGFGIILIFREIVLIYSRRRTFDCGIQIVFCKRRSGGNVTYRSGVGCFLFQFRICIARTLDEMVIRLGKMIPFPILKLLPAGNRVAVLINKIRLLTVSPELMWIVSYPFVIGKSIFFLNIKFLIFAIADPDGGKISIKLIEESGAHRELAIQFIEAKFFGKCRLV